MREIKFRGWDGEEMHGPVWMDFSIPAIMVDNDAIWFKPKELMQYTGLKDKNGKEIYEGDILGRPYLPLFREPDGTLETAKVVFHRGNFEGHTDWGSASSLWAFVDNPRPYEVIGNIYENPELLGKGEK